ncbi:MAG: hypothetical protein KC620_19475, partial [Myxococcales bacterium]|nr:hypothetical protein [Myxococcales bacterium]
HKLGRLFDSKRARAEFPFVERYIPRPDGQSFGIDCRGDNLCAMEEGLRLMQSVVKGAEAEKVGQVLARLKDRAPWKAVALTSADERALPPLDGLCPHGLLRVPCDGGVYLPPTLGHLRAETVSVTPVTIVPTIDQLIVPAHCEGYGVERQVFARLPEGAERPTDLLTIECRPAKGAQPARNAVLMLSYDNDGALSVVTSPEQVALLQWQARPKMPLLTGAHTLVVRSGERVTLEAQSE